MVNETTTARPMAAGFASPRAAFRAVAALRDRIPDADAELVPVGSQDEGREPGKVVVAGHVPPGRTRAAVAVLASLDPAVRIEWDGDVTPLDGHDSNGRGPGPAGPGREPGLGGWA
jgi:hypothetical protein